MRGRQPSPSRVVKGDPPLNLLAKRPRTLQQGPSAPAQPLLPQPQQRKSQGCQCLLKQRQARGLLPSSPGMRKRREWDTPVWAGSTGGDAPGEDGALKWGEVLSPLQQMMPTQEKRRREGGQITGTSKLSSFSSCSAPGTSQGRDLLALPSWPKGRAAAPSASDEAAAVQVQS